MDGIKTYPIIKFNGKEQIKVFDDVIVEFSLTMMLHNRAFVTMQCTPQALEELVVGFLYAEGVIKSTDDIKSLTVHLERGKAYVELLQDQQFDYIGQYLSAKKTVTTACGQARTIAYQIMDTPPTHKVIQNQSVHMEQIQRLMKSFSKKSIRFNQTGGVHSCALCDTEKILLFQEDIGRHNALDKIIGKSMLDKMALHDKMVLTTGRLTSEIVMKVAKAAIPILVSRSAPTNVAIDTAQALGIVLIGFARGHRMNRYT